MAETLYREFRLNEHNLKSITQAIKVFWTEAVIPFVVRGQRILFIVMTDEEIRNKQQNKRLWGYVYKVIAEQAWANGKQFNKDVWHEYFARMFGVLEEMTLPDGEIITRRKSTTDMTVGEFSKFMDEIEAYAASDLGVIFE